MKTGEKSEEKKKAQRARVPKEKIEAVKRIADEMKNAETVMIVSIKNLPSGQLQKIKKDLRGKAKIEVAKKSILQRALKETGTAELEKLSAHVKEDYALIISGENGFELAGILTENKNPISAKEGQTAEDDIIVEGGPTELVPGPVISELGAVGLQIMVEEGKITIRKPKVIVKKDEKVSGAASSIMQKLGIKPFMIGITPEAFYEKKSGKMFSDVKIDRKKVLGDLLVAHAKAVGFSVAVAYPTRQNIGMLLAKASAHAGAFEKLNKTQQNP